MPRWFSLGSAAGYGAQGLTEARGTARVRGAGAGERNGQHPF